MPKTVKHCLSKPMLSRAASAARQVNRTEQLATGDTVMVSKKVTSSCRLIDMLLNGKQSCDATRFQSLDGYV